MNAYFQLIHATGFNTFRQALEFIKESRAITDEAERCLLPPQTEAEKRADEERRDKMREMFGNISTIKAQEEIDELRLERDEARNLCGTWEREYECAVQRADSMERLYAQQVKDHHETNAKLSAMGSERDAAFIDCHDARKATLRFMAERDMARIVKGDRCWFLAGWVRHLKNVLKLADEHRDDLGAALKSAVAERDTLRDKLANARGWIMANATKPVHDLLRAIEP